ncbi:Threonylcarbamoyladenosine tRNA methylthiotransferase MtaB [Fundidesulfovibrio magnetotacticus]|uniref:Threonylcarbamoyladenosine tRNA methylthiotransferase MtaB n=1 Tax=Fundidesulfovibrio magnetotacticus TaxID=2730080 RepID=A0A6V8LWX1_9BACT|nr:MiaB/RimO family radical SAM methylthiotransferase [Fundidesulfovibrio magnetotacticus]GFK92775.1 Threonylcarbamoyladenosine tRNA methylthiotransferase MtaB [Fundidesulfovibrio magnetotacticus]
MRFFIQTLGCKINQYESQAVREAWEDAGWRESRQAADAQVVLVHTCAVTAGAVADSRGAVRRALREAPGARVLVAGCASQVEPGPFVELAGRDNVIPQSRKEGLCALPDGAARPPRAGDWPAFAIRRFKRSRPVLKVQDGCSHGCTYCIVPRARGGARSRPFAGILDEARALLGSGSRELILSGINLGQFDADGGDFWDMLARLEAALTPEWAGRARLRLSSLDPGMLGPRALEVLAGSRMVCPHVHISLQSADEGVLRAMGRGHYGPEGVRRFLEGLRRENPLAAAGADLLTGFPGESEAAFRATLDFVGAAGLCYAHVFPYSRRPGTVAARAPGQLPREVKKARARALREEALRREQDYVARLARAPRLTVALERDDPPSGASEHYVEVRLEGAGAAGLRPGALVEVRPVRAEGALLLAEPLESPRSRPHGGEADGEAAPRVEPPLYERPLEKVE